MTLPPPGRGRGPTPHLSLLQLRVDSSKSFSNGDRAILLTLTPRQLVALALLSMHDQKPSRTLIMGWLAHSVCVVSASLESF